MARPPNSVIFQTIAAGSRFMGLVGHPAISSGGFSLSRRSSTWARSARSDEHTSELQSLMRISYAVFCLKKKNNATLQPYLFITPLITYDALSYEVHDNNI